MAGNQWARASRRDHPVQPWGQRQGGRQRPKHILRRCRLGDTTLEVVGTALLVLIYADKLEPAASWCDALLDQPCGATPPPGGRCWARFVRTSRCGQAIGRRRDAPLGVPRLGLRCRRNWGVLIALPAVCAAAGLRADRTARNRGPSYSKQVVPEANVPDGLRPAVPPCPGHYYLAADRCWLPRRLSAVCRLMTEWDLDVPRVGFLAGDWPGAGYGWIALTWPGTW